MLVLFLYVSINKSKPLVFLPTKFEESCRMLREVFEVGELVTAHSFSAGEEGFIRRNKCGNLTALFR